MEGLLGFPRRRAHGPDALPPCQGGPVGAAVGQLCMRVDRNMVASPEIKRSSSNMALQMLKLEALFVLLYMVMILIFIRKPERNTR